MHPISKVLIAAGALLILAGLLWQFGGKHLHLGKLPGDIAIEKENFKFYFPVTTSILVSIALSVLMYLINHFTKK